MKCIILETINRNNKKVSAYAFTSPVNITFSMRNCYQFNDKCRGCSFKLLYFHDKLIKKIFDATSIYLTVTIKLDRTVSTGVEKSMPYNFNLML